MACAVSTRPGSGTGLPSTSPGLAFNLDERWELNPQVSVRPERFGALLYHFGTRQLSFLKSPLLLDVVRVLGSQPSARAACTVARVPADALPSYRTALASLAASDTIRQRATS